MTVASVTDLPPVFDGIEAVCFDAFGTLVEITSSVFLLLVIDSLIIHDILN